MRAYPKAPRLLCLLAAAIFAAALTCRAGDAVVHSNENLNAQDFKGANLKRAQFDGAKLEFAQFRKSDLTGANFKGADLQFADFNGAILDDADFTGADLRGAIFHDAKAWRVKLPGTLLELGGMGEEEIVRFNKDALGWIDAMANQCAECGLLSLHYADLSKSKVKGNAAKVDLRGADLRGADLSLASGLDSARLDGAKYDAKTLWPPAFDPAKLGAVLTPGDDAATPAKDGKAGN